MSSSSRSPAFATTRWSLVIEAGHESSPGRREALASLCETYWYPLYAFVRRKGHQPAAAQDLTQAFFAELLEKERLQLADQQRGKFRSFLLASLNHFLINQWRDAQAQKRGGGAARLALDFADGERRYTLEPSHNVTPEKIFERRWALTLLDRALSYLRDEYAAAGKLELFERLKAHLGGEPDRDTYQRIATDLEISENAVKVAAHRLRKRCRVLLRREIAQTVAGDSEVDDELRQLFAALG